MATAAAMAALAGAVAQAAPEPPGGLTASELSSDAAWSWFSDPRAVNYRGSTYMGWISSTGDIVAGAYDHTYGRVQTSVVMANFPINDHNNPAVLVRKASATQIRVRRWEVRMGAAFAASSKR